MDIQLSFTAAHGVGLAGAALAAASFLMERMLPLRLLAIASNACFVLYGYLQQDFGPIALNLALVPVHLFRIHEMRKLAAEMRRSGAETPVSQWLLPHMERRAFKAGETLFRKGDPASEIVYLKRGQVRLEDGRLLGPGALLGEMGLFSADRRRTMSVTCETDGELYWMSDEQIYLLYYQHPALGFYFMRVLAQRLLQDVQQHRAAA